MKSSDCILFSGGAPGAESWFGECAERHRVQEVNFTFDGHQVNNGQEIFVVGTILDNQPVRGGAGWGAEFARLCNKPLHVFDQDQGSWFGWDGSSWAAAGGGGFDTRPGV